ncbi:MAG: SMI1/KNR4 family protein [Planctomycetaceae bacterium]|nr:SMI1/KNR4 family protein [Planctomycetaceae bacterium]
MTNTLLKQLTDAGCKPGKPAAKASVDDAFRQFGFTASKPLSDLFNTANGGRLKRLNSRFFTLKEAVHIWDVGYSDMEWRFFPIFADVEHESDPVLISLDRPLQGYVVHAQHGSDWRVLAPSLAAFLKALKKFPDEKRFFVEDHPFVYPRKLSEADEFAAKGLVDLSYTSKAQLMERSTFTEFALSMVRDDELLKVLRMEAHPDPNSRFLIKRRLNAITGAAAKKAMSKICPK